MATEINATERYRFNQQIVRVRVGNNQELLHCDLTGATVLVPQHVLRTLQVCKRFATLDEHSAHVCSELNLGPMHRSAVREQLRKFAESGLMVPHSLLSGLCRASTEYGDGGTPTSIAKFGVLTRNRPEHLSACLESYARCANDNENDTTFVVADQSDAEHAAANAAVIEHVASKFGVEIWHVDNESVQALNEKLAKLSGVPKSLVDFALGRNAEVSFSGGANRNILLLASVGELILQSDDDSICKMMAAPGTKSGLDLTSAIDPAEFWFPTESEMNGLADNFETRNLFAIHEEFLGKSIGECVEQCDGLVDIDGTSPSFFWRLNKKRARVLVTNSGLVGESGRGENQPIVVLDGDKRNRLIVSEEHYRFVQKNQRVLRGVTRPTITEGSVCFGFNLGLDNREIIPPFLPFFRGEDSLFTALFRSATTNGFFAILPWMVFHSGAGAKARSDQMQIKKIARISFCDVIGLILQSYQARTFETETSKRLQSMGNMLIEIGNLEPSEFERVVRTLWWQNAAMQIHKLETAVKMHGGTPDYWSKDILNYVEEYRNSLAGEGAIVAANVVEAFGEAAALQKQQDVIRQFGELLVAWESLREAAAKLRDAEGCLGKRIRN